MKIQYISAINHNTGKFNNKINNKNSASGVGNSIKSTNNVSFYAVYGAERKLYKPQDYIDDIQFNINPDKFSKKEIDEMQLMFRKGLEFRIHPQRHQDLRCNQAYPYAEQDRHIIQYAHDNISGRIHVRSITFPNGAKIEYYYKGDDAEGKFENRLLCPRFFKLANGKIIHTNLFDHECYSINRFASDDFEFISRQKPYASNVVYSQNLSGSIECSQKEYYEHGWFI